MTINIQELVKGLYIDLDNKYNLYKKVHCINCSWKGEVLIISVCPMCNKPTIFE